MKHLSLTIPSPCTEKWDNFSTTSYGGFCRSCSKEVIDFTTMTEDEIIAFLKTKPTNTCGRFHASQLKTYSYESIPTPRLRPSFAFLKAGIVSIILLLVNKSVLAQAPIQKNQIERVEKKNILPYVSGASDSITVKGLVSSNEDGSRYPGVYVIRQSTGIGVVTDAEGRFVFDHLHEGDVLLFSFIGYRSEEYKIRKGSNSSIEIKMKMRIDMGELSINEIYSPKQSVAKRFWWKVKNLF